TLAGPVVGAFTFTWLHDTVARNTDYWRAMLGAIILILVLLFPQGIAGSIKQLADKWRGRRDDVAADEAAKAPMQAAAAAGEGVR
ncbi:MAG: ABC transporter permease, partial [Pseudacidovorax sp.]|nr:ABC transporter permease [Pseudacidovorax sp.]